MHSVFKNQVSFKGDCKPSAISSISLTFFTHKNVHFPIKECSEGRAVQHCPLHVCIWSGQEQTLQRQNMKLAALALAGPDSLSAHCEYTATAQVSQLPLTQGTEETGVWTQEAGLQEVNSETECGSSCIHICID